MTVVRTPTTPVESLEPKLGEVAGAAGPLDSSSKIPVSQIPSAVITDVYTAGDQPTMLALPAEVGDVCKRTDLGYSYILDALPATVLGNWLKLTDDFEPLGSIAIHAGLPDAHHAQSHSHASHTGVGTDDHHAKSHAHDGIDGSGSVAHSSLSGITADQHHAQSHSHASHTGIGTDDHHPQSHAHGNVTNDGKVGSTANLPLKTGTAGVLEAGAFGTGATDFCVGNDSRLSDARTPVAHNHAGADINSGTIDGDRLPAFSTTKKAGVPATGTPSGKYLKDDGTWATAPGGVTDHASLTGVTSDQHHAKSHNHNSASGAGAIATDQIAKFGDGGTTNYAEIQTSGKYRGYGTGRFKRTIYTFSNGMSVGGTYSFNSLSCQASTLVVIGTTDQPSMFRSFADNARQYCLIQTSLPADYVAGTDFEIKLAFASSGSGNGWVNVGVLPTSDGDSYDTYPTYNTIQAVAMTGSYQRVTKTFTITGTNYNPGDCISIVVMRDAVSGSDTLSAALLLAGLGVQYIADKLGADI